MAPRIARGVDHGIAREPTCLDAKLALLHSAPNLALVASSNKPLAFSEPIGDSRDLVREVLHRQPNRSVLPGGRFPFVPEGGVATATEKPNLQCTAKRRRNDVLFRESSRLKAKNARLVLPGDLHGCARLTSRWFSGGAQRRPPQARVGQCCALCTIGPNVAHNSLEADRLRATMRSRTVQRALSRRR
jgi:hypothetical protein